MTTVNRSASNYRPRAGGSYAIPVQMGSVRNLCPTITPTGQGILSWVDESANELRCAVLPNWRSMFRDDVVESGDVHTVWSGADTIHTGVCWAWGGDLYAFVSHYDGVAFTAATEMYAADDVENPASWSLVSALQTVSFSGISPPFTVRQGGQPTVLDSGRWVLPWHTWRSFVGAMVDGLGLFISDDSGGSWSKIIDDRRAAGLGGTAGPEATTVGHEPSSGDLWFGAIIGSVDQWRPYQSADDGSSWVDNEQPSGNLVPHYYIDDGTDLYAALFNTHLSSDTTVDLYRVNDPTDPGGWDDLGLVALESATDDLNDGMQVVPLFAASGGLLTVAFTWRERIARSRSGSHVGYVGKR